MMSLIPHMTRLLQVQVKDTTIIHSSKITNTVPGTQKLACFTTRLINELKMPNAC